jgi:hypothetical protein
MKKNFSLTSTKHKPDRQVELVKHEVNKYIARERRKDLSEGVDFWDFDCKCGITADSAAVVHVEEISKKIDEAASAKSDSIYIEILAKPGVRKKKV